MIVPSNSDFLLGSSGANTKASPFVVALQNAGVKGLPSVFNAVITIAVLSVANSCTFGSTRTFQALASQGMAPRILAYVDRKGRPLASVALQLAFALLAFINEAKVGNQFFNWLLSLSGLGYFFTWGSICWSHLRFRRAWHHNRRSLEELPYVALFGVWGSWFGLIFNILCLIATFYVALFVSPIPSSSPRDNLLTPCSLSAAVLPQLASSRNTLLLRLSSSCTSVGRSTVLRAGTRRSIIGDGNSF